MGGIEHTLLKSYDSTSIVDKPYVDSSASDEDADNPMLFYNGKKLDFGEDFEIKKIK
jgi:hypothetical protein